jgi:uncharacterized protein YjiK
VRALLPLLPLLTACSQEPGPKGAPAHPSPPVVVAGYDLAHPLRSFELPPELKEVSGIAACDAHTIACLQDEKGSLYFFDLDQGRVVRRVKFGPKGDYEGLARLGDGWFALRSDGLLLHLANRGERIEIEQSVPLPFGFKQYEGVACDQKAGILVIAPKSEPVDKDEKGERPLFAVDLATLQPRAEPLFVLRAADVSAQAPRFGVQLPPRVSAKGHEKPSLRLHFAEVAVHPDTGDLWLLCGAGDRAVLVVDRKGEVKGMHVFAADEMPQPEGATFLPDGSLALASEGVDGPAVLRIYGKSR